MAVVTDNGVNMVKAVNDIFGSHRHLPCFAHTLNLVCTEIIDGDPIIKTLCDKIKNLVTFFKQSVCVADELRKYENLKLIQCVSTRWNFTYYMLERFIILSESVSSVLLKFPKSPAMLTASELQLVKEVVLVMGPLESATRDISDDLYVTASKVIINCLNKLSEKNRVS